MMEGITALARVAARVALAAAMGLGVLASSVAAPASGALGQAAHCRAPSGYATVDVGTLGGATLGTDLNDHGLVVGRSETGTDFHAFRWEDGGISDLTPPGGMFGSAIGTNDRGQVLHEWYDPASGENRAFLWRHGRTTEVDAGAGSTYAYDLNERGEVLLSVGLWRRGAIEPIVAPPGSGFLLLPRYLGDGGHVIGPQLRIVPPGSGHPSPEKGFVWRDGVLTDITVEPLAFREVIDVDRTGRVLVLAYGATGGWATVLWEDGQSVDLGGLGGPVPSTSGTDVNDRDQVVGSSTAPSGEEHAFLWDDGRMIDLHPIAGVPSSAFAINERGEVVGTVATEVGGRIVVWSCGQMVDVGVAGPYGSYPIAINDRGQVLSGASTLAGDRVFLSTPIRG